jgi:FAD/FMN-containing dehydrogenase
MPWQNWAGKQSCVAREFAEPASEEKVSELVRSAADRGLSVRVRSAGTRSRRGYRDDINGAEDIDVKDPPLQLR